MTDNAAMVAPPIRRPAVPPRSGTAAGRIRIIGGHWRGTRLPVPDLPGLRPTPDRVRETLFNWLAPHLPGSACLDLFAGSGALGLEAASRGAARSVLVERERQAAQALRDAVHRLQAQARVEIVHGDALAWLAAADGRRFDIAFVDPPFAQALWQPALDALAPRLAAQCLLYVETPPGTDLILPPGLQPFREGHTRDTHYRLLRRDRA